MRALLVASVLFLLATGCPQPMPNPDGGSADSGATGGGSAGGGLATGGGSTTGGGTGGGATGGGTGGGINTNADGGTFTWSYPLPQGNPLKALWSFGANDVLTAGDTGTVMRWNGAKWSTVEKAPRLDYESIWAASPTDVWFGAEGMAASYDGFDWRTHNVFFGGVTPIITRFTRSSGGELWADTDSDHFYLFVDGGFVARPRPLPFTALQAGGPGELYGVANGRLWAFNEDAGVRALDDGGLQLKHLWAFSPTELYALGGKLVRFDGGSLVELPFPFDAGVVDQVVPVSPSLFWTRGSAGLARWEPGSFTVFDGGNDGQKLYGLAGVSAEEAWACGDHGVLWHKSPDAGAFDNTQRAGAADFAAVQMLSPSRGYAFGEPLAQGHSGLFRWDGGEWMDEAMPVDAGSLLAGWAASENDVWAFGRQGLAVHFDGGSWARVTLPGTTTPNLLDAHGRAADDVWVVGSAGAAYHLTSSWTKTNTFTTETLTAVFARSANDVWAAGTNGMLRRWDGQSWGVVLQPTTIGQANLTDIWASSDRVYVVGEAGTFMYFDGTSWTYIQGVAKRLRGVTGRANDKVWAVGAEGQIWFYDGKGVTPVLSPTFHDLLGISAAPGGPLFVVGAGGTILRGD